MVTKTDTATSLAAPTAAGKTFDPKSVEFKAGATKQDRACALALAYVGARLDAAMPDWRNEYVRE